MTKKFYEEYYKNGQLTECMPISLNRIGFIHQDFPQVDEDEMELEDFPTRLIVYLPEKIKKGDFGTVVWSDNGLNMKLSAYITKWITLLPHFSINEVVNKTNWYPIPHNERGQLAKGITNIN